MLASILVLVASLNVNTVPVDSLKSLKGIGSTIAARMDAARKEKPFADCADVDARVKGIGAKKIAATCPEMEF